MQVALRHRVHTGPVTEPGVEPLTGLFAEPQAVDSEETDDVDAPAESTGWRAVVRPRNVLALLALGFAVHLLLPQVGTLKHTLHSLADARWQILPVILATTVLQYVGAAFSLMGSCVVRLRLRRTVAVTLAAAFADKLAPGNLGSLGLINAYLLRSGASVPVAAAAVSLDAVSGFVVHGLLLAAGALAIGDLDLPAVHLPRHWRALLLVVALFVLVSVVATLASRRRQGRVRDWLRAARRGAIEAGTHFAAAVRNPRQATLMLGGSLLITASQAGSLYAALRVFDVHPSPLAVVVVYLVGSALGAVSPTPGGLGAVEAALVAGLTSSVGDVASGPAITAVLLYRLATYWLPILPGLLAYRVLRRAGRV